ncbi:MAG: hypothetical protein R8N23_07300 [Reichenbachiella sp.]|uniref:hypothetical protein n=1 Tax=Reichenbachiella sp. TaxID=2184521 RepID=UPI0029667D13|nr:hypothetical protein [Reichenbachiella sp.]MDW3209654.1 hypothetical protein [Reichenbachiella sp.]
MTSLRVIFTEHDEFIPIFRSFRMVDSELYHVKPKKIAENIVSTNNLQITRGDSFIDKEELKFGISILTNESQTVLNEPTLALFLRLINSIETYLKYCYVFCATKEKDLKKFQDKDYGDTQILIEQQFFFDLLSNSRHQEKINDGFRLHHTDLLYKTIEGFIIYDFDEQRLLALEIIAIFKKLSDSQKIHLVDESHMIDAILSFIVFTKRECFSWEQEYRVVFIRHEQNKFELQRDDKNKSYYIDLFLSTKSLSIQNT